jgi:hypothetical protein
MNTRKAFLVGMLAVLHGALSGCDSEEDLYHPMEDDQRAEWTGPLDPMVHHDSINRHLGVPGTLDEGALPAPRGASYPVIISFQGSASITADNTLFLPMQYVSNSPIEGLLLSVRGAESHWDIPLEDAGYSGDRMIPVHLPELLIPGPMALDYCLYDSQGNIGTSRSMQVSIVSPTLGGGGSQTFPRVEGRDGLTVRTYDLGAVEGQVYITWNTYDVPDRIDVRYGTHWVESTGSLLDVFGQPPVMDCQQAGSADGFVGSSGTFYFTLDPSRGSRFDIYVSGCLNNGTLWWFQVDYVSPQNSSNWYDDLPDCPCSVAQVPLDAPQPAPVSGRLGRWDDYTVNAGFHPGAVTEYRWTPLDSSIPSGQQCTYDAMGRLITSGLGAGTPDRYSPPRLFSLRFPPHYMNDVMPWSEIPCDEYLRLWPPNRGNCGFSNPVRPIDHILFLVRGMTCDQILQFEQELLDCPETPARLMDYILSDSGSPSMQQVLDDLVIVCESLRPGFRARDFHSYMYPDDEFLTIVLYFRLAAIFGVQ